MWQPPSYPFGQNFDLEGYIEPIKAQVSNTLDCVPPPAQLKLNKKLVSPVDCQENFSFCTYRITLSNVGGVSFSGPVEISDIYHNGTPYVIYSYAGFTDHGSNWSCSQSAANTPIQCSESQLSLAPGENSFFDLTLDIPEGGTNCARLELPTLSPILQDCVDTGDARLRADLTNVTINKTPIAGQCPGGPTGQGPCTFRISMTNTGNTSVSGLVTFVDSFTGPEITTGSVSLASSLPNGWICDVNDDTTTCTNPNITIGAQQIVTMDLPLELNYTTAVETNCVELPNHPLGATDSRACSQFFFSGTPLLSIEKSKVGNSSCPIGTQTCSFNISIQNSGTGTFNGPLIFRDSFINSAASGGPSINFGSSAQTSPNAWSCSNAQIDSNTSDRNFDCTHPQVIINPGSNIIVNIVFDYGGAFATRTNCVSLKEGNSFKPSRCISVADPTVNIAVEQEVLSNASNCNQTGNDQCRFRITLTNNATQTYSGPAQILDIYDIFQNFTSAPQSVGHILMSGGNNGWACNNSQGSGIVIDCRKQNLTINPGASESFEMILDLSGTLPTNGRNCARLEGPLMQARPQACVSVGQ